MLLAARTRTLVALLVAEAVSSTGTAMTFVALPWFVLQSTGSAPRTSVVLAVEIAPMAIFGIPSGSLVGRLGARATMLISDGLRAPLIALVPTLYWTGHLSYGRLLAIVFLIGVFTAPYFASQRSIVPELFGDDEVIVSKASALFGAVTQVPTVIGPALAGVLIGWIGSPAVLVIDAGTYFFALLCVLVFVSAGRRVAGAQEDARGVLAGVRYLARDRLLGPMTLTVIVLDMAGGALTLAVPLLAFTRYHENAHIAGWLFTAFGIGAILGFAAASKLLDRVPPLRLASAGIMLAPLPLWVVAAPVSWPVACSAIVVAGFFLPMVNAPTMGLLSTRPPAALRAKVLTAVLTAHGLGSPVGRLVVGPAYRAWGNAGVWVIAAGMLTVGGVFYSATALRAGGDSADTAAVPTG